jgi:hexosaminidase
VREPTTELGDVIPVPVEVWPDPAGDFTVDSGTAVRVTAATAAAGTELAATIRAATGYAIPTSETAGSIAFALEEGPAESYTLSIAATAVTIAASDPAGAFAAVQTLRQLLPLSGQGDVIIPGGRIVDRPRFRYRGVMLDVARHFFTVRLRSRRISTPSSRSRSIICTCTDRTTRDGGWRSRAWPKLTSGERRHRDRRGRRRRGLLLPGRVRRPGAYAAARFVTSCPRSTCPGTSTRLRSPIRS